MKPSELDLATTEFAKILLEAIAVRIQELENVPIEVSVIIHDPKTELDTHASRIACPLQY